MIAKNKNIKSTKVVKQPKKVVADARLRKKPEYKSFKLHKVIKHHDGPLISWWQILKKAFKLLAVNKKHIAVFCIVYGLLTLIFVRGLNSPVDISGIRETLQEVSANQVTTWATNFTAFGLLFQSSTKGAGEVSSTYQSILLVVSSLALIWFFRQQQAGNKVSIKMAFYRGMYPLVPFIGMIVIMTFQLIPALVGKYLFDQVNAGGLAVTGIEQSLWLMLYIGLIIYSLYMISASLIAMYIVTLPEMTPFLALKKAKEVVTFRRFSLLRKVAALPILLLVFIAITVFPALFISELFAQWLFFFEIIFMLPLAHAYLYTLYRELL